MSDAAPQTKPPFVPFVLIGLYIIGQFGWRLFVRAGAWPMPPVQYLSMAIDLGLILLIIMLHARVSRLMPQDDGRRALKTPIFAAALFSGVGMFIIRFSSDVGWWTGHLRNWTD